MNETLRCHTVPALPISVRAETQPEHELYMLLSVKVKALKLFNDLRLRHCLYPRFLSLNENS